MLQVDHFRDAVAELEFKFVVPCHPHCQNMEYLITHCSLQRWDPQKRVMVSCWFPVLRQLLTIQPCPLPDQSASSARQSPLDDVTGRNVDGGVVLAVDRVEVREVEGVRIENPFRVER